MLAKDGPNGNPTANNNMLLNNRVNSNQTMPHHWVTAGRRKAVHWMEDVAIALLCIKQQHLEALRDVTMAVARQNLKIGSTTIIKALNNSIQKLHQTLESGLASERCREDSCIKCSIVVHIATYYLRARMHNPCLTEKLDIF